MRLYLLSISLFITSTLFAQITSFPYTQDFESFNTCQGSCNFACPLSGGWVNASNETAEWTVDEGGTSSFNTGPSVDHNPGTSTGNYLYTETSGCNNATANLISPTFDFSILSNPTVEFWWHMFGAAMGDMHFDLDTGNGVWIQNIIPSWTANQNTWQFRTVNLTNLAAFKPNVRFRVRGETGTSFTSDMAVDDFRVFNDIPDDLAITKILSPLQDCGVTGTLPIEIEITNLGASDQNNFSLAYQVNDLTPVTEPYVGTLNSDQKDNFTFQTPFNFSAPQDFIVKTWVIFPMDLNKINDTLSEGVKEAFPLEPVDFSGFNGSNIFNAAPGWSEARGAGAPSSGTTSAWKNSDSIQRAFLGSPTAKVNMFGNQNSEWIVSPPVLISNSARLFFSVAATAKDGTTAATMGSDDKLQVFISTDCGNSFSNVFTVDRFSNLTNSLREFALNLNNYVGQEIIFGFKAQDGPVNDPEDYDLHLTLIEARRVFPNDVGIIDFRTQDGDKIIPANTGENIFIRLKNFGSNTVSNVPIVTRVGTVNFQNVFGGTLTSNAETEINIGAYFGDPNGSPKINIRSYTLYNNDTINNNDTLKAVLNVDGATGIDQLELLKNLRVIPNPFSEQFSLNFEGLAKSVESISISDLQGRVIERISWNGEMVFNYNSKGLPRGVYLISINTGEYVKRLKCIKE